MVNLDNAEQNGYIGPKALGLNIKFEGESETQQKFAHVWITDGSVFGKAKALREHIPVGTWITIPPALQPAITWYLCRHAGFLWITRRLIDNEWNDVLLKTEK